MGLRARDGHAEPLRNKREKKERSANATRTKGVRERKRTHRPKHSESNPRNESRSNETQTRLVVDHDPDHEMSRERPSVENDLHGDGWESDLGELGRGSSPFHLTNEENDGCEGGEEGKEGVCGIDGRRGRGRARRIRVRSVAWQISLFPSQLRRLTIRRHLPKRVRPATKLNPYQSASFRFLSFRKLVLFVQTKLT